MNRSYMFSDLNTIRKSGDTSLKLAFDQIVQANQSRAINLLNDQTLSFPTFYILMPQIVQYQLEKYLSPRNQFSLEFSAKKNPSIDATINKRYLKWMLYTSINQELDSDEFQAVIDRVIIQLLVVLNEPGLLALIVNLIFSRNRKNHCTYDLCWAIYQSNTVSTMPLIATYIKSSHSEDNKLAYKLLNFKPDLQPKNRIQQYNNFCKWFRENKQFLYFNNETMQETCQPKLWRVNLPAKYLCKSDFNESSLNDKEKEQIQTFLHLDRASQKLLSKYSYQMYLKNYKAWQNWMNTSVSMQFETCKNALGDRYKQ